MPNLFKLTPRRLINLNHLVQVEYTPPESGIDDETGQPYQTRAQLTLTLSSVDYMEISRFDGETVGGVSVSDQVILRDDDAERVWKMLEHFTYPECLLIDEVKE